MGKVGENGTACGEKVEELCAGQDTQETTAGCPGDRQVSRCREPRGTWVGGHRDGDGS